MTRTLGIDFGTSNSSAGVAVGGTPYLIPWENGQKTLPTSVFFDFDSRKTLFGETANRALVEGLDGRFMRALKSVLGTPLMHEKRRIMGQSLSFVDIVARFLIRVKSRAEAECHQTFDNALSGRPVHFHSNDAAKDKQALADLRACYLLAGFKDVHFMFEPEAAALAANPAGDASTLHLIVDIGGGTSDFTVFRRKNAGIEILASHGVRVGGTNFDRSISFDHVMPEFGKGSLLRSPMGGGRLDAPNRVFYDLATWQMIPFLYTPEAVNSVIALRQQAEKPRLFARLQEVLTNQLGHDVAFAVESGKIQANSGGADAAINLSIVEKNLRVQLSKAMLAHSMAPHLATIETGALETVKQAGCLPAEIGTVVFVGGSSLMQDVQRVIGESFASAKHHQTEAFTAVVDGLALAAARQ